MRDASGSILRRAIGIRSGLAADARYRNDRDHSKPSTLQHLSRLGTHCRLWGQTEGDGPRLGGAASLCDLRNSRERFGGKTVQVEGWIYTDIERFLLSDGDCAVPLENPDPKPTGLGMEQLDTLVERAKMGTFNTGEEVFAVVVGRFLIEETKVGNDVWKPGFSPSRSVLLIQRVVCSAVAPMTANTKAAARSKCQQ